MDVSYARFLFLVKAAANSANNPIPTPFLLAVEIFCRQGRSPGLSAPSRGAGPIGKGGAGRVGES